MESVDYLKFAAALIFVIALMGGLSFVLRRLYGFNNQAILPSQRRLKILETLQIDPRRKLILIQKDSDEHLLLLGPSQEILVGSSAASTQIDTKQSKTPS